MKRILITLLLFLFLMLCGCDALLDFDTYNNAVSSNTDDYSKPTSTSSTPKPSELTEKERMVSELLEQDYLGYDLVYKDSTMARDYVEFSLIDFDRKVKTNVSFKRESSYIVIKTKEIIGTQDTEWCDLYDLSDENQKKYAIYSKIVEIDGEQIIQDFQKFNGVEYKEKIIENKQIEDKAYYIDLLKKLLDKDARKLEDTYDSLFP